MPFITHNFAICSDMKDLSILQMRDDLNMAMAPYVLSPGAQAYVDQFDIEAFLKKHDQSTVSIPLNWDIAHEKRLASLPDTPDRKAFTNELRKLAATYSRLFNKNKREIVGGLVAHEPQENPCIHFDTDEIDIRGFYMFTGHHVLGFPQVKPRYEEKTNHKNEPYKRVIERYETLTPAWMASAQKIPSGFFVAWKGVVHPNPFAHSESAEFLCPKPRLKLILDTL